MTTGPTSPGVMPAGLPKGKRTNPKGLIKNLGETKASVWEPAVGVAPYAVRGPQELRYVVPGATAHHALAGLGDLNCFSGFWGFVFVQAPLPNVTCHI